MSPLDPRDSAADADAQAELHEAVETAAHDVATELLERCSDVLELTERQRDGMRAALCAAFSRGMAWEFNWTAGHLEEVLGPVLGNKLQLGRVPSPD